MSSGAIETFVLAAAVGCVLGFAHRAGLRLARYSASRLTPATTRTPTPTTAEAANVPGA